MATDDEVGRSIRVAEQLVEVLSLEPDCTLALAGMAMALAWLATSRSAGETDALQLIEAMADTTRQQTAALYQDARTMQELPN